MQNSHRHTRRAFTLVEMLVVIGIIIVIIGITAPAITRAWRSGERASIANDLQVIAGALEAYRTDHGDYPRVDATPYTGAGAAQSKFNGARMLCRALVGPGPGVGPTPQLIADGAGAAPSAGQPETLNAPGFRIRGTQGKVYGPYIPVQNFKIADPDNPNMGNSPPGLMAILDRFGRPILYYPGTGKPNIRATDGYIKAYNPNNPPPKGRPLYNANDNTGAFSAQLFPKIMGDMNANGMIDGAETPAYDGTFILWSAGPDEQFGPPANTTPANLPREIAKMDDVTNFRQ